MARGLWYVAVTVAGEPCEATEVLAALQRFADERPFLLEGRYGADRAELRYWEEADTLEDAAALALRLWGEHRATAGLPPWQVVGLEVLDAEVLQSRAREEPGLRHPLASADGWRPYPA